MKKLICGRAYEEAKDRRDEAVAALEKVRRSLSAQQSLIESARERSVAKGDTFRFYLAIPSHRENLPVHDDLIEDVHAGRLHGALFIGHNKPAVF